MVAMAPRRTVGTVSTPTAPRPWNSASAEIILRVANQMTLRQVADLAQAAAAAGPRSSAREFTVHQDLPTTLAVLRRLTAEQRTVFPEARHALADSEGRARRAARSPAVRAPLLTSVLFLALGLLAVTASAGSPAMLGYSAAAAALGAVSLALTFLFAGLAVRLRLMRLEITVAVAWVAVCDAVVAVELLDEREPGSLPGAAYAVLTQPWTAAVLPLPQ